MPMNNPAHPGLLIREELDFQGASITSAAADLHISRQHLYRILRGESAVTAELAIRLESLLGGQADGWLRMQANYDLARARTSLSSERQASKPTAHLAPT